MLLLTLTKLSLVNRTGRKEGAKRGGGKRVLKVEWKPVRGIGDDGVGDRTKYSVYMYEKEMRQAY